MQKVVSLHVSGNDYVSCFAEESEQELMGHCLDWGLLCYRNNIISSLSASV